jgi:hypothetical protein
LLIPRPALLFGVTRAKCELLARCRKTGEIGTRGTLVCRIDDQFGLWLSLVERLVRDQEAVGSNPTSPIELLSVKGRISSATCDRAVAAATRRGFKSHQRDVMFEQTYLEKTQQRRLNRDGNFEEL